MSTINIKGKNKAAILAALYNNARPLGMGFLHYTSEDMSVEQAQIELDGAQRKYFDYLGGRVMKIDLSGDELRTGLYDRDNGVGAAENALKRAGII
jgi:hypothetical protein